MIYSAAPTPSAIDPDQTLHTPITPNLGPSNDEFLSEIFLNLDADERPMVLGIPGSINAKTKWSTGLSWTRETSTVDDDLNWYFTLSTYRSIDSMYRRKKEQFQRAYGVYLDDVGTKAAPRSRLDACPPSYLVETSEGNFQAGYLFSEPCADLAQVEALHESMIKSGLCDSGANGPSTRLGRLPCAINGKHAPAFRCRLVEWHPERRYTIEQIVEQLELEPTPSAGGQRKTRSARAPGAGDHDVEADVHLPRAAENAVIGALRQRGLYKLPLGDGKHDLTCPWVHEHTDRIDHGTAYFEPSDGYPLGGFKCQHAHGSGMRIGALLDFLDVSPAKAKHKPTIRVAAGELHRVVDAAERELAAAGRHYQRGGLITNVVTDPATGETIIKAVTPNALMRALSSIALWERYDARRDEFVQMDPPTRHVNVLFDSEVYHHLPVLRGIARQPYLREDGSLMIEADFDPVSGMFGAFDARAFNVPARPTMADAERAVAELQALLAEFSFAQPHDMSAALGMILTAAIRPSLPAAPMGHIKAPMISSGKSYLTELIAAFAGPSRPSAYAFPSAEEECAKLLLAALLESASVVAFDNLTTDLVPFKSLCSALTEQHLTGRILGISKTATVPTRTLFLSSGNNVDPVRDMTRRVITISLDPACETPATRRFTSDPVAMVRAERERFVSLALTVVRAYLAAGCPEQELMPLASYGEWTRLVRAPLVWLGLPDPAAAIYTRMAEDPDRETLGRLLVAWRRNFGVRATPVRDVVDAIERIFAGRGDSELGEVVREIAEERGVINRRRLGRWIARCQGRIVSDHKFERDSKTGGSERWRVVVSGVPGVSDCPTGFARDTGSGAGVAW